MMSEKRKKFLGRLQLVLAILVVVILVGISFVEKRSEQGTQKTFACAVNCMDGRVQCTVENYLKQKFGVYYVDAVTEAGPCKILAENTDTVTVDNIKKRVGISFHHHGANVLAVVAHQGCAGNPVRKEEQIIHLRMAKKTAEAFGFEGRVVLLWVEPNGMNIWLASEVE